MRTALLLLTIASLAACSPFVETNERETRVGIVVDHQAATEWLFSLFSRGEELSLVNEK